MSAQLKTTERTQPQPDPKQEALEHILQEITTDAQHEPETYLRDSEVPEGGE